MSNASAFSLNSADAPALRKSLAKIAATGYTESIIRAHLNLKDLTDFAIRAISIYRAECLSARAPLDIAIDLFLLQGSIKAEELNRLLNKDDRDAMVRCGILSMDNEGAAEALVSLYPVKDRLIFSDHAWPQLAFKRYPARVPYDQVMYIGTDSRWLARATVRRPVETALDLCTGSGIHALLASSHVRRVVACDINPRAVRCTLFNAQASGVENIEALTGDLFGPVKNEKFDLITANPPFVPSPQNRMGYRDGGPDGESVQRRIVAGLPDHLTPSGMAHLVTEIGERDGEPIVNRIRHWLQGAPMDIHVIRLRDTSASRYAIGHAEGDDPRAFLESVDIWASNLRSQGYARIISLLVTFQWSNPVYGPPWDRVDEALAPTKDAGAEIEATFAAERMSRNPRLLERLRRGTLKRTGPVILLDGHVTGLEKYRSCKATLSVQALPVKYYLDSIERNLLVAMDNPADCLDILKLAELVNISESALYGALRSLIRKRLITIANSNTGVTIL